MSNSARLHKALIFHNPGFEADLAALLDARPSDVEVRTFSTVALGAHFLRIFPQQVLGLDVSMFRQPRFAEARRSWARRARELVSDLYARFPFDVAVAPADDTPYWPDIGRAIEELGVPFVVLFKEATHPPGQLRTFAPVIRANVPVTARHVLVNSQHTAEYMIACGAPPEGVTIIGQPRFDTYAAAKDRPPSEDATRTILFLTYEADAYRAFTERAERAPALMRFLGVAQAPENAAWPSPIDETWLPLRCATERTLVQFAAARGWRLLVKPHRQMDPLDREFDRNFIQAASPAGAQVSYLDPTLPLEPLLKDAAVVVGFQTTALLEAMLLGKHVIYAAWGERLDEADDQLVPFAAWSDAIAVCRSPAALEAALRDTDRPDPRRQQLARTLAEEWLGPLDGHAAARAWRELERICATRTPSALEEPRRARARRERQRTRFELAGARARQLLWSGLGSVAALGPASASGARKYFGDRAAAARARTLELHGRPAASDIAGPFEAPLVVEISDLLGLVLQRTRSAVLRDR